MTLAGLPGQLPTLPVKDTRFRAVSKRFQHNPLGFVHPLNVPSRSSAGNGRYLLLYLACDRLKALFGHRVWCGLPACPVSSRPAWQVPLPFFSVIAQLNHVIQLGDPPTGSRTVMEPT